MAGHEHLEKKGYQHMWGIGRHLIGSQLFDYWADPWGRVHEHWADTDVLNAHTPPNAWSAAPAPAVHGASRSRRSSWVTPRPDRHRPQVEEIKACSLVKSGYRLFKSGALYFAPAQAIGLGTMQADGWAYRVILALSGITLILVVVYLVVSEQNRTVQAEINRRQQFINQSIQFGRVNEILVRTLASVAVSEKDEKLRELLAQNGITINPKTGAPAPAPETGTKPSPASTKQ